MTQITEAIDVVPNPAPPAPGIAREMEIRYYTASQFQLMWWKFKKHRLALIGTALLAVFVFIALFAEFLSPYAPAVRTPNYLFGGPQVLHFVDAEGKFHLRPFTYALTAAMDPADVSARSERRHQRALACALLRQRRPIQNVGTD